MISREGVGDLKGGRVGVDSSLPKLLALLKTALHLIVQRNRGWLFRDILVRFVLFMHDLRWPVVFGK